MYRHTANSILENDKKRFISATDKKKYDEYEQTLATKEDTYSKEEIEVYTKQLESDTLEFEGKHVLLTNTCLGMINNLEIMGETRQSSTYERVTVSCSEGRLTTTGGELNDEESKAKYGRSDAIGVVPGESYKLCNHSNDKIADVVIFYNRFHKRVSTLTDVSGFIDVPGNVSYIRFGWTREEGEYINVKKIAVNYNQIQNVSGNISVNITGENLINPEEIVLGYFYQDFIKINEPSSDTEGKMYAYTRIKASANTKYYVNMPIYIVALDIDNLSFIEHWMIYSWSDKSITTSKDCYLYIRSHGGDSMITEPDEFISKVKLTLAPDADELATPYESKVEGIQLPVQLNGLGEYRDRIFKREDGMWCFEKRINTINTKNCFVSSYIRNETTRVLNCVLYFNVMELPDAVVDGAPVISNLLAPIPKEEWKAGTNSEGIYCGKTAIGIGISFDSIELSDDASTQRSLINKYLKSKAIDILYPMETTEIIELPEFNGVELSLDMKNTSISAYSGNIIAKIKGSAPISLASVVDSHTITIDNIKHEVEDIKRLKAGSSTDIKTNSAVTILPNTKYGNIDDVKIVGRTLVNHAPASFKDTVMEYECRSEIVDGVTSEQHDTARRDYLTSVRPHTEYTIMVDVLENTLSSRQFFVLVDAMLDDNREDFFVALDKVKIPSGFTGRFVGKFKTVADVSKQFKTYLRTYKDTPVANLGRIKLGPYLIIEGDYTNEKIDFYDDIQSVNELNPVLRMETINEAGNLLNIQDLHNGRNTIVKDNIITFINKDGEHQVSDRAVIPVERNQEYILEFTDFIHKSGIDYGKLVCIYNNGKKIAYINSVVGVPATIKVSEGNTMEVYITTENQTSVGEYDCNISIRKYTDALLPHESDRKDIVMVKDLVNIYDGYYEEGDIRWDDGNDEVNPTRQRSGYINISGKSLIRFSLPLNPRVVFYNKDRRHISSVNGKSQYRVPKDAVYVRFSTIKEKYDITEMEVQAFSPIILRSVEDYLRNGKYSRYDSIEKHINGKWYYHKRCNEIQLHTDVIKWSKASSFIADNTTTVLAYAQLDSNTLPLSPTKTNFLPDRLDLAPANPYIHLEGFNITSKKVLQCRVEGSRLSELTFEAFESFIDSANIRMVYGLEAEEIYEVMPLDLTTFDSSTAVNLPSNVPAELSFSVSSHVGNIVESLKNTTSSLEDIVSKQNIFNNRFTLMSRYTSDKTTLKIDILTTNRRAYDSVNDDIFTLIYKNIITGRSNYNRIEMEEIIDFYTMINVLGFDKADILLDVIEKQHLMD